MSRRRVLGAALVVLAALGACSSSDSAPRRSSPARSGAPSASPPAPGACPTGYADPDPQRPRMTLRLAVAADHDTVSGQERITFTPDRAVRELVFRLTANSPTPEVTDHPHTTVTSASADHGGGHFTVTAAGAQSGTQGGLLHIPFARPVSAGTTVHATLAFTLHLGAATQAGLTRFGRIDGYAYLGSGAPLLAWQRGYGWHTENMVGFPAETATSEAMALDLTVTAPAKDVVIASGNPSAGSVSAGRRSWHSTLAAARDVSVAAGPFVDTTTEVDGVVVHLGAYDAQNRDDLLPQFRRAITELVARYGPFPFPSLSVARLPLAGGGIEYPGSILMLDGSRGVAVHETAHQYFYAMVGDSQALHPWLDEAFAQFSEEVIDGQAGTHPADLSRGRAVDTPVGAYGSDQSSYYFTTYNKGSAALEAARAAAGTSAFDAALRCYVRANAWRVVVPQDLANALVKLPRALAVLRKAGALE